MPRYDDPEEPFYFGEVIGSALSYHLPTCHIIRQIRPRNYKRLRDWQEASKLGLNPCPHCRPPEAATLQPRPNANEPNARPGERPPLTASELGDLRRDLMSLLVDLEPGDQPPTREGLAPRIERLTKAKVIPREVAACMRTITALRNAAENEAKISQARTFAVEGALRVIQEWAGAAGVALPNGLKADAFR